MLIDDFRNPPLAEICILLGSNSSKKVAVFEGNSDVILWESRVDFDKLEISVVEAQGKDEVLECVAEALSKFPNRIIGIVDRDYGPPQRLKSDNFNGIISSSQNDIEIDILTQGEFPRCIEPSLSKSKLDKLGLTPMTLEQMAVEISAAVGGMRKLNHESQLGLDFQCYELKAKDFYFESLPHENWFDPNKIVTKYLSKDSNKQKLINESEFKNSCIEAVKKTKCKVVLCRGHDISNAISIFYNKLRKSNRSSKNSIDINDLILGHISDAGFSNLKIYQDFMKWSEL